MHYLQCIAIFFRVRNNDHKRSSIGLPKSACVSWNLKFLWNLLCDLQYSVFVAFTLVKWSGTTFFLHWQFFEFTLSFRVFVTLLYIIEFTATMFVLLFAKLMYAQHVYRVNLVQKIKIVRLSWNLTPRLIRMRRIQWWCSFLPFSTHLLGQIWFKISKLSV